MKCLYIPREINQRYILLWRQDEVIFLFMSFIFLFIGGFLGLVLTLISIITVITIIRNMGRDKMSGYLKHWALFNSVKPNKNHKHKLFTKNNAFPPSFRHIAG